MEEYNGDLTDPFREHLVSTGYECSRKYGSGMKYLFFEKYMALVWLWLLLISIFTVLKIAPDGLNADILLNSVMSLQNLTLYYWGQNRLLNVLPFAVAFLKNPTLNLAAVLLITAISFYGFIFLLSRAAVMLLEVTNKNEIAFKVFLISSSVFVLIFSPHAISDIAIGHIEYSFPALLLVFACIKLLPAEGNFKDWQKLFFSVSAIILAIGLNPSTLIPAVFISMATAFYRKKVRVNEIVLLVTAVVAFFIWNYVSNQYGSQPYNEFKLEIFYSGHQEVVDGLIDTVNLTAFIFWVAFISIGNIFLIFFKVGRDVENRTVISYITNAALLFSIGWLFLFASSRWVEMNQFAWRYFIYIIFSLFFVFTVRLAGFLNGFPAKGSTILTTVAALVVPLLFVTSLPVVNFNDYRVFQRVNSLTEPGGNLYSGDYWVVWPSVLRDMMNGYEAYGLTPHRGHANEKSARDFVLNEIIKRGYSEVYCLEDSVENCIAQVNAVSGPLFALGSTYLKEGVHLIKFASEASSLDYSGADFLHLPSQVGNIEDKSISSKSKSGFLVYGPYVPLKAGRYHLSVVGHVTQLVGAYVDVVSDKGAKIHAKFDLSKSKNNFLIDEAEVNIPSNISDLEVRVWVSEGDEIELYGYSLKPY